MEKTFSVFKPTCFQDLDRLVVVSEEKRTIYIVNEACTKVIVKKYFATVTGRRIDIEWFFAHCVGHDLLALQCFNEYSYLLLFRVTPNSIEYLYELPFEEFGHYPHMSLKDQMLIIERHVHSISVLDLKSRNTLLRYKFPKEIAVEWA